MPWGEIELEPEVEDWYGALPERERAIAARHIDLLADRGVLLDEPHTRQLDGKLRELRFHLGAHLWRVTYYIATGRRIILLTVFPKARPRERREVERARRAMARCIEEGHTADDIQE